MASKRDERKRLRQALAPALRIHLAVFRKRSAKVKPRFGELNGSCDV